MNDGLPCLGFAGLAFPGPGPQSLLGEGLGNAGLDEDDGLGLGMPVGMGNVGLDEASPDPIVDEGDGLGSTDGEGLGDGDEHEPDELGDGLGGWSDAAGLGEAVPDAPEDAVARKVVPPAATSAISASEVRSRFMGAHLSVCFGSFLGPYPMPGAG